VVITKYEIKNIAVFQNNLSFLGENKIEHFWGLMPP
jgi:hypothetical protein